MKKVFKVLTIILGLLLIVVIGLAAYLKYVLPNVGKAPEITVERTPERIQRGEYLANHITVCMDCHSTRDWSKFSGPLAGDLGAGGEKFSKEMGFPGTIYSANITPFGIGDWTDGEVFRAITTGVNKDGKSLFPVMPYHDYGKMDQEDIYSIIAYIRNLEPIPSEIPERELDFPVNLLINTLPAEANLTPRPDESDRVNYGKYLVNAAGCIICHSKVDANGNFLPGTELGGGRAFEMPAGTLTTPNITFHETGLSAWTSELFVQRFKMYVDNNVVYPTVTMEDFNSAMPWGMYAGMKTEDLEAIYLYLQSVPKIDHKVERYKKREATK